MIIEHDSQVLMGLKLLELFCHFHSSEFTISSQHLYTSACWYLVIWPSIWFITEWFVYYQFPLRHLIILL
jgi:hypothetical protein